MILQFLIETAEDCFIKTQMLTNQFPKLQNQAKYLVKSVIPCNKAMIVFVASIFHGHICEIKIVSTKSFQFLKVGCSKSNPFTLAKNPGMPYVSITLNVATSMNALRTVWNYPDEYKNVIHLGCFKFFQRKFPNKLNHLERERERCREGDTGKAVQFWLFYIELDP